MHPQRKRIYFLIGLVVLLVSIAVFIKPLAIFWVRKELRRVFIESKVSVNNCRISLRGIGFSDIKIERKPVYDFRIKEAKIYGCPPLSLNIHLSGLGLWLNLGQEKLSDFRKYLSINTAADSRTRFPADLVELSDLRLFLKSRDISCTAELSAAGSLQKRLIKRCALEIDSLSIPDMQFDNIFLKTDDEKRGTLSIQQIRYNKLKIKEISAGVKLEENGLSLTPFSAALPGGGIEGSFELRIDDGIEYFSRANFTNCDLEALVKELDLGAKFQMSGLLSGKLTLAGRGGELRNISGEFSTLEPGGTLVIKDDKFLRRLSRLSNQPLDILVENLKDYRYNIGVMRLGMEEGNLILRINLDGETGKRDLHIVFHDFKTKKEER